MNKKHIEIYAGIQFIIKVAFQIGGEKIFIQEIHVSGKLGKHLGKKLNPFFIP